MTTGLAGPATTYSVNDRMYSALVESLRGIVWEADSETFQFCFVSNHAETLLGFPREEWLEDPQFWRHHTHPDDIARAAAFCKDCIAQGKDHEFEYRMIARDGRVVWLRDIVTVDRSTPGKTRLRGIMIDITERHEMEDRLRESQERLAHAQQAGGVGTFEWDLVEDIAVWTTELKALYGEPSLPTPKEIWFRRVHPADLVNATDAVQDAMDTGVLDAEYRVCWPDGTIHWLHARGRASHDASGRPVRMIGAVVDVTDRKQLQQDLHQAQKMEALGRLAGGIAHDFNNLLTIISTYGELLATDLTPDNEHADELNEIRRAAERGAQLTRQLLAFSRKDVVTPGIIGFDTQVADVTAMLERLLGRHVQLVVDLGGGDAAVLIGPGQIQQIVMNLAVNARDAMPSGGRLAITTRAQDGHVGLVVSDTGEGMSDTVKSHLFEPFFTTKQPGKGTGLGLSTVFGLVRQANGTITVESTEGEGTSVEIRLPRAR
ncbi:MAG TPA: PAS domain-containing protein [Gemmatimonadaceae bacterium]|nr:PAS domain-containing protein [Gemmatimonadaceae bacterium]